MAENAIISECNSIRERLAEGGKLNKSQAGEYLLEIGRLCLNSSKEKSSETVSIAYGELLKTMQTLASSIDERETDLNWFLGGAHGISDSFGGLKAKDKGTLKDILAYNGLHWGGIGELLTGKVLIGRGTFKFSRAKVHFSDGKVELGPKSLREIIRTIPHLFYTGDRNLSQIDIRGNARLTAGQLFGVLRGASNSLHSIKMNNLLHRINRALKDKGKIATTVDHLSEPANLAGLIYSRYKEIGHPINRGFAKVLADDFISFEHNKSNWRIVGAIHPSDRDAVKRDLLDQNIGRFEITHFNALRRLGRISNFSASELYGMLQKPGDKTPLSEALKNATSKRKLRIDLDSGKVIITDSGLGTYWEKIAKLRQGSGTSDFLQRMTATITRKISPGRSIATYEFA